MKILNPELVRALDAYTIQHEPIASIDLMERASRAFVDWFTAHFDHDQSIRVFCGLGNNGGDGLAIARLLAEKKHSVSTYVIDYTDQRSEDFAVNYERLAKLMPVRHIKEINHFPLVGQHEIFIDAIFGSGLSRPVDGLVQEVIKLINAQLKGPDPVTILSVDIASGLFANQPNPKESTIMQPTHTVSFQMPKLAFMLPENAPFVGEWHCVDIGLNAAWMEKTPSPFHYTDATLVEKLIKPRNKFSHKGTFGHALLISGSYGKMGAAVLAARACLRSGVGLLTVRVPQCGYEIIQTAVPEAMALTDDAYEHFSFLPPVGDYAAIGIGPGLGKAPETLKAFTDLLLALEQNMPPEENSENGKDSAQNPHSTRLVIDADALNLLAENREWLKRVPPGSILTPHPKEFERLAGKAENDYDRLDLLREFAKTHQLYVTLKGAHTAIATPEGDVYFNATGNAGMAKGGSGDVLTGMVTALAAHYSPLEAVLIGVYQHGIAGDRAAGKCGQTAMTASDIVDRIGW